LGGLGPDEGREYVLARRSERGIIEEVARELGLWYGQAGSQGLLVYREGPVAARLRQVISVLGPGEFGRVGGLTAVQALFGQALAQGAGIWAAVSGSPSDTTDDGSEGQTLELFNNGGTLEDFTRGVRRTLRGLREGEVVDFPGVLTEEQRNIVHNVAQDFMLVSKTLKDPPSGCHASVGNLPEFQQRVSAELSTIAPGESRKYGPGQCERLGTRMTRLERSVVQQVATDLGFRAYEQDNGRGGALVGVQNLAQAELPTEGVTGHTHDPDVIRQKVAQLFGMYSSGKQGEKRFFLRKIDLTRFVQDAARVSPRAHILQGCLDAILRDCERVFDETLELQIDLGCRKRYGLTMEYFQVFLSKASYILGWSMVSLLFALLELFE